MAAVGHSLQLQQWTVGFALPPKEFLAALPPSSAEARRETTIFFAFSLGVKGRLPYFDTPPWLAHLISDFPNFINVVFLKLVGRGWLAALDILRWGQVSGLGLAVQRLV